MKELIKDIVWFLIGLSIVILFLPLMIIMLIIGHDDPADSYKHYF